MCRLFSSYLGRRNARFIRNYAGVLPLTSFLVYPKLNGSGLILRSYGQYLNHHDTEANLYKVAKTYGAGALKVEPRALERLPIPEHLLDLYDLHPVASPFEL